MEATECPKKTQPTKTSGKPTINAPRWFDSPIVRLIGWVFGVPQVAAKEERSVLWYASDGLRGEMECLGPAQRQALKVVLDKIADGSGVVDVDGSGRKAGVEGLTCQGFVAGKG